jgi:hypothetical protein
LQDEYAALQSDIKRSLDDKRSVQENSRLAVEQLRAELDAKRQECEELRAQVKKSFLLYLPFFFSLLQIYSRLYYK